MTDARLPVRAAPGAARALVVAVLAAALVAGVFAGPASAASPRSEMAGAPDAFVLGGPSAVSHVDAGVAFSRLGAGGVRLGGRERFATAARVALSQFPGARARVYVANGYNYPDALAGGALAGQENAPVVLVDQRALPEVTADALRRFAPREVVVLGGAAAVSDEVVSAVRAVLPGVRVERVAGPARVQTAIAASQRAFNPGVAAAFVATGRDYRDALVGAPLAALHGGPVLLNDGPDLHADLAVELRRLRPGRVVLLGNNEHTDADVAAQVRALGLEVERVASHADVLAQFSSASEVFLATGADGRFPDSLAGAAAAASSRSPIALTNPSGGWDADVVAQLERLGAPWLSHGASGDACALLQAEHVVDLTGTPMVEHDQTRDDVSQCAWLPAGSASRPIVRVDSTADARLQYNSPLDFPDAPARALEGFGEFGYLLTQPGSLEVGVVKDGRSLAVMYFSNPGAEPSEAEFLALVRIALDRF